MNQHVRSLLRRHSALAVFLLGTPALDRAQEPGPIAGRVIDATSNAPISAAQVVLVGTTRGVVAGDDGRFRIAGVRPGQYTVRALRLGYQASAQTVDVTSAGTVDVNFALAPAAVSLEEVVTTATGERERKREIGSAGAKLQPPAEQKAGAPNRSQPPPRKEAGGRI